MRNCKAANSVSMIEEYIERELEYLKAILEHVEDGIVACNEHGQIAFFNRVAREFHGVLEEPLWPEEWTDKYNLFQADEKTPMATDEIPLYRAFKGEVVQNAEMVIVSKTGEKRLILASGRPILSSAGKKLGAVVVMHDITERKAVEQALTKKNNEICAAYQQLKQVEQELLRANNELERRVAERTEELYAKNRELSRKNEALKKINQDLDNFIYIASHDLKVPVLNVEGLVQILRQELLVNNVNREVDTILEKLDSSAKHMRRTIDDVKELARAQRTMQYVEESINLEEVVDEVKCTIDHIIKETDAVIETDFTEVPSLFFSHVNLKSIFYNLLTNAVKYRAPQRKPVIKLRSWQDNNYVVVTVQDNGLGIDLDRSGKKLFGMFERLHDHVEGSGIGLYIVKRVMEASGGTVQVESVIGEGTSFILFFNQSFYTN